MLSVRNAHDLQSTLNVNGSIYAYTTDDLDTSCIMTHN
jgi:hypothetical protein